MQRARCRVAAASLFAALSAVAVLAASPSPVAAHATIDSVTPPDGAQLETAPSSVSIVFSEPIADEPIGVRLARSDGATEALSADLAPGEPHTLVVHLPTLVDGAFQIRFAVRDREDLHEITGRSSFSVGDAVVEPTKPDATAPPGPFESLSRWVFAAGFALVVGGLVVRRRADQGLVVAERVRRSVLAGASAMVVGRLGVIVARVVDVDVDAARRWSIFLGTDDTKKLPVVVVAAALTTLSVRRQPHPVLDSSVLGTRRMPVRDVIAWCAVGWIAVLVAWGDHAALRGTVEVETALAKAAHLLGLGLWVGTLATAIATTRCRGDRSAVLRSVSAPALAGAVLTVASGFLLAGRLVVSVTALLSTTFGVLLAVKSTVLVVAVGLGAWGARQRARGAASAFVPVVEATLLVVVVAIGASIATAGPAIGSQFLPASGSPPTEVNAEAGDLLVRVRALPARPGPNTLEVHVSNTRRPAPGPIGRVEVLRGAVSSSAAADADGLALVQDIELSAGQNDAVVTIDRPGLAPQMVAVSIAADIPRYVSPVRVSSAPIRWWCRGASVAALVAGFSVWVRTRRRRTLPRR